MDLFQCQRKTRVWLTESQQGEKVAQRIGAAKYVECSAKTNEGVRAVFETATRLALLPRKKKAGRLRSLFGIADR